MLSKELLDNLLKRATGYTEKERTIEYAIDDEGNRKPIKERTQDKVYPPDMQALKLYLELSEQKENLRELTDEELEKEKVRLLKILNNT